MVVSRARSRTKNDCFGESQRQFIELNRILLILKMATEKFTETLQNPQHSTQPTPEIRRNGEEILGRTNLLLSFHYILSN
jgi:hypothetical protein